MWCSFALTAIGEASSGGSAPAPKAALMPLPLPESSPVRLGSGVVVIPCPAI